MTTATQQTTDRWLDTASGRRVNLTKPAPESIAVEDIAGALSRICRFGGHTSEFYSVAQHSVLVANMIAHFGRSDLRLVALHHDSHEAYLGDMPTPLKKRLRDMDQYFGYAQLVEALDLAISRALGIPHPTPGDEEVLLRADRAALQMEARLLLPNNGADVIRDDDYEAMSSLPHCPSPWSPSEAARRFITLHRSLVGTALAAS